MLSATGKSGPLYSHNAGASADEGSCLYVVDSRSLCGSVWRHPQISLFHMSNSIVSSLRNLVPVCCYRGWIPGFRETRWHLVLRWGESRGRLNRALLSNCTSRRYYLYDATCPLIESSTGSVVHGSMLLGDALRLD